MRSAVIVRLDLKIE